MYTEPLLQAGRRRRLSGGKKAAVAALFLSWR